KKTFEGAGRVPGFSLGLKNYLYINDGNTLYVLDKDGNEIKKWSTQSANHSSSAPTIYSKDGTIYVGGADGIFAYNPDYTLKWKYSAGIVTESPVIDKNGIVYFKASNEIHALNPDGTLKWKMPLALTNTNANNSITIGADGTLYTVGAGGSLIDDSYYYSLIAIGDTYIDKVCTKGSTFMEVLKSLEAKSKNAKLTEEEKKEARDILNKLPSITQGEQGKKEACDILNKLSSTQGEQFEQGKYDLQAGSPFGQNWSRNLLYAGTEPNKIKWEYKLYHKDVTETPQSLNTPSFGANPAIGRDETIYVTTGCLTSSPNTKLHALNADGSVKWKKEIMSGAYSMPVIAEDGTIYVTAGHLLAFNPDGSIKWQVNCPSTETPVLDRDGTIYVRNTAAKRLEAYNPDGSKKWSSPISDASPGNNSMLISKDGTIYTLVTNGENKYLYAHDKTGKLLWSKTFRGEYYGQGLTLGINNEILVNTRDKLYVFDKNGNIVHQWKEKKEEVLLSAPTVSSTDGTIYVGGAGYIYAYNPDYSLKWKYLIPTKRIDRNVGGAPVIDKNGVIYFNTASEIYALNPDGTLKWEMSKSTTSFANYYYGANNSITISKDGTIYLVGRGGEGKDGGYASLIAIGDSYTDNVCTKESTFIEVLKSLEAKSKNAKLTEEEKKEAREILNKISNDLDKKDN
uniref:outer membrane protein assembly factor BamB family protein n=1 Tax=Bacillus sp. 123MFChir2 TaxID=1169144 RepID=UPI0006849EF3